MPQHFSSAFDPGCPAKRIDRCQRQRPEAQRRLKRIRGVRFEQPSRAEGESAFAEFEALPGERVNGRIAFVYPTLNPETRTVRVRAEMPNAALRLKPGMYATFHFTGGSRGRVLSVPSSAVLTTGERNLVFVRRADGQLEPRAIHVGVTGQDRVEVLSGLTAGETVVASATFLVDAESNLGSALGGMGNMPGMDITAPKTAAPTPARPR